MTFGSVASVQRAAILLLLVQIFLWPSAFLFADVTRSGHPPTISSIKINDQRQMIVTFSAPDGMKYGGWLLIDYDPKNAVPVASDPKYGPIMFCNNSSTCKGSWGLPKSDSLDPTVEFTTPSLSLDRFPAGTYYIQVDTHTDETSAMLRQEEFSPIAIFVIEEQLKVDPAKLLIPKLFQVKIPFSNGEPPCLAGLLLLKSNNDSTARINEKVAKIDDYVSTLKQISPFVEEVMAELKRRVGLIRVVLEDDAKKVKNVCSKSPSIGSVGTEIIPIPVPFSNGSEVCNTQLKHAAYINQELRKIANNMKVTKGSQTIRLDQLKVRFNQISTDLAKSWPAILAACEPKFYHG